MFNKGKVQFISLSVLLLASLVLVGNALASPAIPNFQPIVGSIGDDSIQHECSYTNIQCPGWNQNNSCCSQGTGKLLYRYCSAQEWCWSGGQLVMTEVTIYQHSCGSPPCYQ